MNAIKQKEALATGVAVSSMSDEERKSLIKRVLTYGIVMRSQNMLDEATFEVVANGFNDFLKEEFPNLRDKELDYVMRLGISGELGSSMETFVCGASLMRWVRMYYQHPERIAQIEAIRTKQNEEQEETDEQRSAKACDEAVHRAFEFFKKHHTIFGEERNEQGELVMQGITLVRWAGQIYDYYKKAGNIPEPSEADKRVAQTRAEKAVSARGTKGVGKRLVTDATFDDWYRAFLLEQYFASVLKVEIII